MALSDYTIRRLREHQRAALQVVSGSTVYRGGFAAIGAQHHATAANRGRVYPYNDAAGSVYAGLCQGGGGAGTSQGQDSVVGTATEANKAALQFESFVVEKAAVSGVNNKNLVTSLVYLTDDNTLTTTRPAVGCPLGMVIDYSGTSGTCDVWIFSVETIIAIVMGGCAKQNELLGSFLCADMTNATQSTWTAPHMGYITKFYASVKKAPAGTSGTTTITLKIGSTAVGPTTPASLVVLTGDAKADLKASAAITANNVFHEGDVISVVSGTNTTMTAGSFDLFVEYLLGPGI